MPAMPDHALLFFNRANKQPVVFLIRPSPSSYVYACVLFSSTPCSKFSEIFSKHFTFLLAFALTAVRTAWAKCQLVFLCCWPSFQGYQQIAAVNRVAWWTCLMCCIIFALVLCYSRSCVWYVSCLIPNWRVNCCRSRRFEHSAPCHGVHASYVCLFWFVV